jgi:hypothetical protein
MVNKADKQAVSEMLEAAENYLIGMATQIRTGMFDRMVRENHRDRLLDAIQKVVDNHNKRQQQ